MTRIALFSDVHGVAQALGAVSEAIAAAAPDVVAIAGDLAMNGADPAAHDHGQDIDPRWAKLQDLK